jgi:hypothetical protein
MFHVDPRGDTDTIGGTTTNTGDDVIISLEGKAGIGILPDDAVSPHSLTLTAGGTPSAPRSPLRIEDGRQQEGRILTGDADGRGTWKDLPAGFTSGRVYGLQGISARNFPHNTGADVFTFTADVAGKYLFEIRWWGKFKNLAAPPFIVFELRRGSSGMIDSFEQYMGANPDDSNNVASLCITLYGEALAAGNVFTVNVRAANREQATQESPAWTQGKANVLRITD